MNEKIIPLILCFFFLIFGINFFLATERWKKYQLKSVAMQEKDLGEVPLLGWWLRKNLKWLKGNFGNWYARIIGIALLIATILFFFFIL
jgi:hypothetical protein